MDRRKRFKIIAIFMFILAAGTIYSCTSTKKQEPEVFLLNQELTESSQDRGVSESLQDESFKESSQDQVSQPSLQVDESQIPLQSSKDKKTLSVSEHEHLNYDTATPVQNKDNSIQYIYVHLCGAVKNPAVYKVEENTRLVDVILLAGGLTENAAGDFVNQASLLEDGQQIYIPTIDEVKDKTPLEFATSVPLNKNENSNSKNSIININVASQEELMTLPGIGEAKAKSIVDYREKHNGFQSIEEIKNIDGIKDSVFNKIKDSISVK